jgi:2-(1,2-epoxy-1,2-dihydrophenyl)acetyl-CoA isomerase
MSEFKYVDYTVREGGVAVLLWNRPEAKNALLPEMTDEAGHALERAASDTAVRALVLSGAGDAFSAGADLKRMAGPDRLGRSALVGRDRNLHGIARTRQFLALSKPTVAAVHGAAAGMACAFALACDVVVASTDARFHFSFVRVGFVPDSGTSWLLVRRVGIGRAKRMVLTGDPVGGEEALRIGLCDELTPPGGDLERAITLARTIAERPPLAVHHSRRVLEHAARSSFDDAAELEAWTQGVLGETEDHKEAVRAFVEKRPPRFTGS